MKAIITRGSLGLGFEIAEQLREQSIDVLLIGRNKEKLNNAKARLHEIENDTAIECYDFDISDEKSVINFFGLLNDRKVHS